MLPALRLSKVSRTIDPNLPAGGDHAHHGTLVTILRNLFDGAPGARTPMDELGDALTEVNRVAAARHVSPAAVQALVASNTQGRTLGFLGEPRVNVLTLNIALDQKYPFHG